MELDPKEVSRAWWKGALTGAVKGIPQGLLLGLGGALILWGLAAAVPALGLAAVFHGFLFTSAVDAAVLTINPVGFIALNTVLTVVGNFLTGGDMAVNAYKQQVDHDANVARLNQLETRELQLEQQVPPRSRAVQKIIENGPRHQSGFEHAEETRDAQADKDHTIH